MSLLHATFSDNKAVKAADVILSWDMDRDDSKQVGIKATMNRGDSLKGDITLSLPSLRKVYMYFKLFNTELMFCMGETIVLDCG